MKHSPGEVFVSVEQQIPEFLDRPNRFTAPRAFVMADPGRPPHFEEWEPGLVDAVIIDVLTCAARQGVNSALSAARTVLGSVRACLDAQVWLRMDPTHRIGFGGHVDPGPRFAELAEVADGVVLPDVRSAADVDAAVTSLGRATAIMPVVDLGTPLSGVERLAVHPRVVRLAAATRAGRVKLSLASQVHGLPAPVNAVTVEPMDTCELMHDAVLARCDGFGGQCVPVADLAADVRALHRDAGRD
ncbi:hypothetical protein ACWCXB_34600 [Streptomyces sp. NPDC001514]